MPKGFRLFGCVRIGGLWLPAAGSETVNLVSHQTPTWVPGHGTYNIRSGKIRRSEHEGIHSHPGYPSKHSKYTTKTCRHINQKEEKEKRPTGSIGVEPSTAVIKNNASFQASPRKRFHELPKDTAVPICSPRDRRYPIFVLEPNLHTPILRLYVRIRLAWDSL